MQKTCFTCDPINIISYIIFINELSLKFVSLIKFAYNLYQFYGRDIKVDYKQI